MILRIVLYWSFSRSHWSRHVSYGLPWCFAHAAASSQSPAYPYGSRGQIVLRRLNTRVRRRLTSTYNWRLPAESTRSCNPEVVDATVEPIRLHCRPRRWRYRPCSVPRIVTTFWPSADLHLCRHTRRRTCTQSRNCRQIEAPVVPQTCISSRLVIITIVTYREVPVGSIFTHVEQALLPHLRVLARRLSSAKDTLMPNREASYRVNVGRVGILVADDIERLTQPSRHRRGCKWAHAGLSGHQGTVETAGRRVWNDSALTVSNV